MRPPFLVVPKFVDMHMQVPVCWDTQIAHVSWRKSLGVIPQIPPTFVFMTKSLTGLELTKRTSLASKL